MPFQRRCKGIASRFERCGHGLKQRLRPTRRWRDSGRRTGRVGRDTATASRDLARSCHRPRRLSLALDLDATAPTPLPSLPQLAMKALYPASNDIPNLPDSHLALKIARHTRCSDSDCSCPGLRPPPGWRVFLDTPDGTDSDDDGEPPSKYLDRCGCGHGVSAHGADLSALGHDEFARRGRVAVRVDELLEVRLPSYIPCHVYNISV